MIRFRLEIVGGPYDGVRGLVMALTADGESLPEWIWLGLCRGDGDCAIPECPGRRHPAFWLPREDGDQPPNAMRYELRDRDDVRRVGTYAVGGVRPVQTAVAADELPMVEQENPLVPAGAAPDLLDVMTLAWESFTLEWESWAPDRAPQIWQLDGVSVWRYPPRGPGELDAAYRDRLLDE